MPKHSACTLQDPILNHGCPSAAFGRDQIGKAVNANLKKAGKCPTPSVGNLPMLRATPSISWNRISAGIKEIRTLVVRKNRIAQITKRMSSAPPVRATRAACVTAVSAATPRARQPIAIAPLVWAVGFAQYPKGIPARWAILTRQDRTGLRPRVLAHFRRKMPALDCQRHGLVAPGIYAVP